MAQAGESLPPKAQARIARILAQGLEEKSFPKMPSLDLSSKKRGKREAIEPPEEDYMPSEENLDYPEKKKWFSEWSTRKKLVIGIMIVVVVILAYILLSGDVEECSKLQPILDLF